MFGGFADGENGAYLLGEATFWRSSTAVDGVDGSKEERDSNRPSWYVHCL